MTWHKLKSDYLTDRTHIWHNIWFDKPIVRFKYYLLIFTVFATYIFTRSLGGSAPLILAPPEGFEDNWHLTKSNWTTIYAKTTKNGQKQSNHFLMPIFTTRGGWVDYWGHAWQSLKLYLGPIHIQSGSKPPKIAKNSQITVKKQLVIFGSVWSLWSSDQAALRRVDSWGHFWQSLKLYLGPIRIGSGSG